MLRVLVVEDSPVNLELVVTILQQAGHTPVPASNAAEALELARAQVPDAILMDIQLPGMDGLAATRLLKADPQTRHVPIIALTAFAMKGDEEAAFAAGVDGYITKPLRYQHFLAELERVVARSRARGAT